MIEKEKALPLKLMQLEALLRRLPFEFEGRQLIEVDLARWKNGYLGEKSLEYYLRFLDEK
ncbi:hypothetical protein ACFFJY_07460 [Fictibacillus aquaticus]|uniref:hypothetical protein n=1 Tax=Fictibacillus aquaticus TaxID=2021314 RepID=UPI0010546E15|nr:hypothetical protein [Fictibacillus aquaticus]